jgi:hypothetical protein
MKYPVPQIGGRCRQSRISVEGLKGDIAYNYLALYNRAVLLYSSETVQTHTYAPREKFELSEY